MMITSNEDLSTFEEAVSAEHWRKAMKQEIQSIEANNTRKLVKLPASVKTMGVKWIYI